MCAGMRASVEERGRELRVGVRKVRGHDAVPQGKARAAARERAERRVRRMRGNERGPGARGGHADADAGRQAASRERWGWAGPSPGKGEESGCVEARREPVQKVKETGGLGFDRSSAERRADLKEE